MMHFFMKLSQVGAIWFLLSYYINGSSANDEIENHPNLNLLPEVCGNINEDYTISDKPHFEEFPWMALIFNSESDKKEKFLSSGTLINSRYVLTMVECTDNGHYNARNVRIGEYNINTESDCEDEGGDTICALPTQNIGVEKVDISSDCHTSSCTNCIALLRLEKALDFKQRNAGAICLPMATDLLNRNLSGVRGTLAGWGLSSNPNTLRKSSSTVVSADKCKEYIRTRNIDKLLNTVCVKGSMNFEIGAPMMIKTDYAGYKRYTQYGIFGISTGLQDSDINLFVDITKYMKWILDTIKV